MARKRETSKSKSKPKAKVKPKSKKSNSVLSPKPASKKTSTSRASTASTAAHQTVTRSSRLTGVEPTQVGEYLLYSMEVLTAIFPFSSHLIRAQVLLGSCKTRSTMSTMTGRLQYVFQVFSFSDSQLTQSH